ncbi:MAG: outer membrane homotrimeric porin [Desulfovibrionaceae bacterium]|nr:outer membrane homotrimeric porin [Desulfovibrionaceae bacterium]
MLLVSLAGQGLAAEVKATGEWAVEAIWTDNWDFVQSKETAGGTDGEEDFNIWQRARTQFEFLANENLKAYLATEIGTNAWGESGVFDLGASAAIINVRRAYVDFNWPDSKVNVQAGFMPFALPAAIGGGSFILDEEASGFSVGAPLTDNVGFLAGYVRALSGDANHRSNHDAFDLGFLVLPLDFDGLSLKPFFVYGFAEADAMAESGGLVQGLLAPNATAAGSRSAWWAGLALEMTMFDPFVLRADFNYGATDAQRTQDEMSGWLFDLSLEYTGWDFVTPELFFAYSSGEDNSTKGDGSSGRMPILAADTWAIGSFYFGGDALLSGSFPSSLDKGQQLGFWLVALSLKDMSFIDKLSHTVNLMYVHGVNDKGIGSNLSTDTNNNVTYGRTLTEKDDLWEVDLNTSYSIYDELTGYLELGYLNADLDEEVWGSGRTGGSAWKCSLGLGYDF